MKKFISVIFAVLIIASVFSGCSGKSDAMTDSRIVADSHYSDIDENSYYSYEKLCNAVVNGDEEVRLNTRQVDDINQLFYTSFPLNALVESINIKSDKSGVAITYKNDKATHLELVSQFNSTVDDILNECGYGKVSKDRFLFNLYTYISSNFEIDNTYTSVYDTILNHKGVSATINSVFEYILLCGDCKASHVTNLNGRGAMISLAMLDSQYYYFDVASEIEDNSGKALRFFAMDDTRVKSYVVGSFAYTDGESVESVTDDKFDFLAESTSYDAGDEIVVTDGNNKTITVDIV